MKGGFIFKGPLFLIFFCLMMIVACAGPEENLAKEQVMETDQPQSGQADLKEVPEDLPQQIVGQTSESTLVASGRSGAVALSISATPDVDRNIPRTGVQNRQGIAVIIANRDYRSKDVPVVDFAISDGLIIKEYLQETLGFRPGNIMYVENATEAQFRAIFGIESDYKGKLYHWIRPGESDVFIYYSGHGAPDVDTKKAYFMPVDCDPYSVRMNGYSLNLFYTNLAKLPAKSVTVVLDACFSGGSEKGMLIKNASPVTVLVTEPVFTLKNASVFTSSTGDQVSSWYPSKRHGLFTYYFLKGLKGEADLNKDGKITAGELDSYLSQEVTYMARRVHQREQTPQMIGARNTVIVQYK
jgi:hypothetical protein